MEKITVDYNYIKKLKTTRQEFLIKNDDLFTNKVVAISGLLPKDFREVYGKSSATYLHYSRLMKNWIFDVDGDMYLFITAVNRGTTIESTTQDPEKLRKVVDQVVDDFKENETMIRWMSIIKK